jgi:hypothetical protein
MNASPDLSATEARVFEAYWQDGVLDLIAGAGVVIIGVGWILGFVLVVALVPPLALAAWPILRQRVTVPRLGQVRFAARRRRTMRHGLVAVLSLGVLTGGWAVNHALNPGSTSAFLTWIAPGIPALILTAMALSAAEALRLLRFVGYAVGFALAAVAVAALDVEPGWALLAGGLIVTVNGARLLAGFVHEFPRLATEIDP